MKKNLLGVFTLALPFAVMAAPESYTMDPYHTFTNFEVDHNGVSTVRGRFDRQSGKFTIDRAAKSGSVELAVETASVSTGDNDKGGRPRTRDEHLRSADFFNVAEFPQMTFKSSAVKFAGEAPAEITGNVTLLGVTRPVTLHVDRWVCKPNPMSKKDMCGGNFSGAVKRSDFGMKFAIPGVSDEVKLFIGIEAYKN
jgi:polyisoprenoid-binding protein YceI